MPFDYQSPAIGNPALTDIEQIRTDLNELRKFESSSADPGNPVALMFKWETPGSGNYILKMRNKDNDGRIQRNKGMERGLSEIQS